MIFKTFPAMVRACGSAALLAVSVAGCDLDSLLDVTDPSRLLADHVETPAQASALVNGVEADFICALGSYLLVTAVLSDEFEDTFNSGDAWTLDRRRPEGHNNWTANDCTGFLGPYVPVSRARWVADNLVRLLDGWTDAQVASRQARIARAALLAGFSVYMLGAAHCSAALDGGPELTSMQLFAEAESRFSKALQVAQAAGRSDIANAARVGRARVRLYQGNKQGALADAQAVPGGFVTNVFPSDATERMYNRVWYRNLFTFSFGVPAWSRNLMTGGVVDPRTATHDTGTDSNWAPDGTVWAQEKYKSANSPIAIARREEAQLIIAEIQGGQTAVGIINRLRDPWNLPPFASTNESEIQDMVVEERRRELWFEGFRAYDILRLTLPPYPPPGADYQAGLKGGTYGDQLCIPIPIIETFNNKTIRGA
ncbi:MAG: RagB/SusD family nutrient uptake outer membrane protein [Gemmatimonadetes bacterium]|nr:RagB/SusD family nutrient uptake outer membrane protein [Gemmatimonadota bacterium]